DPGPSRSRWPVHFRFGTRRPNTMRCILRPWLASLCLGAVTCAVSAQAPGIPTSAKSVEKAPAPAVNAKSVAPTVNGEPILEGALQRFLRRVPPEKQTEARPAVINHLVDNILVDQYLQQIGIKVEATQVDGKIKEMKEEIKKEKLEYEKVLQE